MQTHIRATGTGFIPMSNLLPEYIPRPKFGPALEERREKVGFRSQRELVRALKALEEQGELPGDLKSFSQQWLSRLEDDQSGDNIRSARSQQIRALAYMLELDADEFFALIGVPIAHVPGLEATKSHTAEAAGWHAPHQPKPIPDALKEAALLFSQHAEFAELADPRWQRFLTDLHHRVPPATAAEWLALFLELRQKFDPTADH